MIKVIIIEDEPFTANRLSRLVEKLQEDIEIVGMFQTVKETLEWLNDNPEPDLYFMDIQLSDGLSFDIFSAYDLTKPVIFTTAYDEYAIKAFKANGIDYLLKPVVKEDLEKSFRRFLQLQPASIMPDLPTILQGISNKQVIYKSNFLVEWRDQLLSIPTTEIAYFWLSNKNTYFITRDKRSYVFVGKLDQLEKELDPGVFFRVNRQFLVSRSSISQILIFFGNRLKLNLSPACEEEVLVSRERVPDFKSWLDK